MYLYSRNEAYRLAQMAPLTTRAWMPHGGMERNQTCTGFTIFIRPASWVALSLIQNARGDGWNSQVLQPPDRLPDIQFTSD